MTVGLTLARRGALRKRGATAPPAGDGFAHTSEAAAFTDEWSSVTDTATQLALTTTAAAVHQGAKGIALTANGGTTPAYLTRTGITTTGTSWQYDFWIKATTGFATTPDSFSTVRMLEVRDATGVIGVMFLDGGRRLTFERYYPGYAQMGVRVGTLTADTWAKISVSLTGGGTSAGSLAFKLNDTQVSTAATGLDFTTRWRPNEIRLGLISTNAATVSGAVYLDDGLVTAA